MLISSVSLKDREMTDKPHEQKNRPERKSKQQYGDSGKKITGFSAAGLPIYEEEVIWPYVDLARAILRKAAEEYTALFRRILRAKTKREIVKLLPEKDELEEFYLSDWFQTLSGGVNGQLVIKELQKRAIQKEKARLEEKGGFV